MHPLPLRNPVLAALAGRAGVMLATMLLACAVVLPGASAQGIAASGPASRLSTVDPLNGGSVIVNMHGMLFHPDLADIQEDVNYARWLGSGVIRVFATDSNGVLGWDGRRVGTRIADIAPMLRAAHLRLIVALVNNHRAVPGEPATSTGWMDNYWQLLLPFYTTTWRGAYQSFVTSLISTVDGRGALDVMYAWELGNELHTPAQPDALVPFITDGVALVRSLDAVTPILPGTMGANHVQPGSVDSPIARWLYCDAPIDAYTLHAYDWVSRQRPGDMPINWDLDGITAQPCPNGRALPVIVEELGTSHALPGVYSADDERARLQQELRQIDFVRGYPQVVGFGVWNGESPRLIDRTFFDIRRGLTSYGSSARGGGSCYDPAPDAGPGVRCQLEQTLRGLRSVRGTAAGDWTPAPPADAVDTPAAQVDRVVANRVDNTASISGRITDPSTDHTAGIESVELRVAGAPPGSVPLAAAAISWPRVDPPPGDDAAATYATTAAFLLNVPLAQLPAGPTALVLAANSPLWGTWLTTLHVEVPVLGPDPVVRPVVPIAPPPVQARAPARAAEIESPQPGDRVPRSFVLQVLAPRADHVEVFLEPGRDGGGRQVGSASAETSSPEFRAAVTVPTGRQSLFVYARSTSTGTEEVLTLPIVVT